MVEGPAIAGFAALAHEARLRLFRLLVAESPIGLTAGELGRRVGLPASGVSFHLAQLERAGLIRSCRVGRNIHYVVDVGGTRSLVSFLVADCCHGFPEFCGGFLDQVPFELFQGGTLPMTEKVYNVLFLCTGNSARSIMAEAVLKDLGRGRFNAYSAGSMPKGRVNPHALELLKRQNYLTSELRSKDWAEFTGPEAPKLDFVFTLCDRAAQETCPVWPGQPMTANWALPDPAAVEGTEAEKGVAFADTLRMLNNRISIFVNLPMVSLDKLTLQRRLDEIGKKKAAAAESV